MSCGQMRSFPALACGFTFDTNLYMLDFYAVLIILWLWYLVRSCQREGLWCSMRRSGRQLHLCWWRWYNRWKQGQSCFLSFSLGFNDCKHKALGHCGWEYIEIHSALALTNRISLGFLRMLVSAWPPVAKEEDCEVMCKDLIKICPCADDLSITGMDKDAADDYIALWLSASWLHSFGRSAMCTTSVYRGYYHIIA